jgi:predicted transcriptional regulator
LGPLSYLAVVVNQAVAVAGSADREQSDENRYSRWDDSDPLAHDTRNALYGVIEEAPGVYLSAVCARAGVALSTGRHHLAVLEEEGVVMTAKVRGRRRYYPDHAPDAELAAALEDEATAEVLHALAALGTAHGGRLADELDRDPSTVSHHLARLAADGLVERERDGKAVRNRLATPDSVDAGDGRVAQSRR